MRYVIICGVTLPTRLEILLPMAIAHPGLMHSILCLSGAHLVAKDPKQELEERQAYHFDCAIKHLRTNVSAPPQVAGGEAAVVDDPTVASVLVLCLKSICAGEINGEYRPHLDMAKHLVKTQPSRNPEFRSFLLEFFVYHDVSNSITSLDRPSVLMSEDYDLPDFVQPEAGIFLGVADGLFISLSQTRQLRDRVRARREAGIRPPVDYQLLKDASLIDQNLRKWECHQPEGTERCTAAYLYRQCAWLYLQRTISPSIPSPQLYAAVEEGLEFLRSLPADSSSMSIVLMPLYLLGLSAFAEEQRPSILQTFADLQTYSNLGNIKHARKVVERVWEMMDAGDEGSWDFEKVQKEMVRYHCQLLSDDNTLLTFLRVWISWSLELSPIMEYGSDTAMISVILSPVRCIRAQQKAQLSVYIAFFAWGMLWS